VIQKLEGGAAGMTRTVRWALRMISSLPLWMQRAELRRRNNSVDGGDWILLGAGAGISDSKDREL